MYVYIMSGLFGGILLLILSAIFPNTFANSILIGASASVIGIVAALAIYIPNLPVSLFGIIEMRYKYYALLIFAISTIIDFNVNTGGKISHFGGAFFGLFLKRKSVIIISKLTYFVIIQSALSNDMEIVVFCEKEYFSNFDQKVKIRPLRKKITNFFV